MPVYAIEGISILDVCPDSYKKVLAGREPGPAAVGLVEAPVQQEMAVVSPDGEPRGGADALVPAPIG